jgi:hypothetical protein
VDGDSRALIETHVLRVGVHVESIASGDDDDARREALWSFAASTAFQVCLFLVFLVLLLATSLKVNWFAGT